MLRLGECFPDVGGIGEIKYSGLSKSSTEQRQLVVQNWHQAKILNRLDLVGNQTVSGVVRGIEAVPIN